MIELSDEEHERLEGWCEWAEARADRVDPITNPSNVRGLGDRSDHDPLIREWNDFGSQ